MLSECVLLRHTGRLTCRAVHEGPGVRALVQYIQSCATQAIRVALAEQLRNPVKDRLVQARILVFGEACTKAQLPECPQDVQDA